MHFQSGWLVASVFLLTAVSMEFWAALLHGRIWHSLLWQVHRSHHRGQGDIDFQPTAAPHPLEWNDLMPMLHAPLAMGFLYWACIRPASVGGDLLLGAGWGMTAFGVAYIFAHDGLAHGRFFPQSWLKWAHRWRPVRLLRSAHCLHHRTGGAPFGLFTGPAVVAAQRRQRAADAADASLAARSSRQPACARAALQRTIPPAPKLWQSMR
jgi:beta-carotene 3-hydroxylase